MTKIKDKELNQILCKIIAEKIKSGEVKVVNIDEIDNFFSSNEEDNKEE